MKKKTRRKYNQGLKEEAVKLKTNQGYSFAEAGGNLDVNPNQLSQWRREIEGPSGSLFSAIRRYLDTLGMDFKEVIKK